MKPLDEERQSAMRDRGATALDLDRHNLTTGTQHEIHFPIALAPVENVAASTGGRVDEMGAEGLSSGAARRRRSRFRPRSRNQPRH